MFSYYFLQRKKTEKSLNSGKNYLNSGEKLVFVLSFLQKKSSLSLSISKLNLLTTKKKNCEEKSSGSQSFQRKSILLPEAIPFSGSCFVQLNLFFLMEAILFIDFFLVEAITFKGSFCSQWKNVPLRGCRFSSGSHLFYQKPFL